MIGNVCLLSSSQVHSCGREPDHRTGVAPATNPSRAKTKSPKTLPKMVKDSVHVWWVRCGKPGCRCARAELRGPYFYLFWRENGQLRRAYVRHRDLHQVLQATLAYKLESLQRRVAWRTLREAIRRIESAISEEVNRHG